MQRHILVLGDDSRSCLAVVRSLGRRGIPVVLGIQDPASIVPASRYVTRVYSLPSADEPIDSWLSGVSGVLEDDKFDLLIPTADDALVPLVQHRTMFEPLVRCAIPDDQSFEFTYYKHRTLAMAQELGVPTPPTIVLLEDTELSRFLDAPSLALPLIVKPSSSKVWPRGSRLNLDVRLVSTWDELQSRARELLPLTPVLIQSFLPGTGVGQEFLAERGDILLAFQHERVHEPPWGGGSSYRRSVAVDPVLLEWSAAMLRHMQWTGVAMIEFKRDPASGRVTLMEINGRFWGSLPLSIAAGVDFPYGLYELLVVGRRPAQAPYATNIYARNVLRDVDWFVENQRADRRDPFLLTVPTHRIVAEIGIVMRGHERWDTVTLDDPRPGLVELRRAVGPLLRRAARAVSRGFRAALYGSPAWRQWQRRRVRQLLRRRAAILLVCKGNICRSPFAERYLKQAMARRGINRIEVASAGLIQQVGRPSPGEACEAARHFGINLDTHRSGALSAELATHAGVIFCMDRETAAAVQQRFPNASHKSVLLGALSAEARDTTIADPWGQPLVVFRGCYGTISSCLDALVDILVDVP